MKTDPIKIDVDSTGLDELLATARSLKKELRGVWTELVGALLVAIIAAGFAVYELMNLFGHLDCT